MNEKRKDMTPRSSDSNLIEESSSVVEMSELPQWFDKETETSSQFFLLDESARFLAASESFAAIHGIDGTTIAGRCLRDLYPDEVATWLLANHKRILSDGGLAQRVFVIDGRNVDILLIPSIRRAQRGRILGVETDRSDCWRCERHAKEVEETCERERLLLERLSDIGSNFFFLLDDEEKLLLGNRTFMRLTGGRLPSGRDIESFFDSATTERWRSSNRKLLEEVGERVDELLWRDGDEIHCLLLHRATLVRHDGTIAGIVVSGTDLTKQRRLEDVSQNASGPLLLRLGFMQQIIDAVPSLMLFFDADGVVRSCNQAFADAFDLSPGSIYGKKIESLLPTRFESTLHRDAKKLIEAPGTSSSEYRIRIHGRTRTFLLILASLRDQLDEVQGVIGIGIDVTDYKRLEAALLASQERLQLAYQATDDGFWDWNPITAESYVSSRLVELFHFQEEFRKIPFFSIWDRVHPDNELQKRVVLDLFAEKSDLDEFNHDFRYLCGDDRYRWFHSRGIVVRDENRRIKRIVASVTDIDARKKTQARVEYLATHDALTGLPNRTLLVDRIEQELALARREGTQCAVVFADLDHFKDINDTLGHDVGDLLLCEMASRLTLCVREFDTVARIGGDEFVMLLCRIRDIDEVVAIVERIVFEARKPFILGGECREISGSVGIAVFPEDGATPTVLMKRADEAMYVGKRSGRNQYVFWRNWNETREAGGSGKKSMHRPDDEIE